MKHFSLTLISFFLVFYSFAQNLLQNGTFDSLGIASGRHWFDYCGNEITYLQASNQLTCFVNFANDAPPGAQPADTVCVHPAVGPPGNWGVRTFVTGISGMYIYKLNYWMKSLPDITSLPSAGCAEIGTCLNGTFTPVKSLCLISSNWGQYTIIDTITTTSVDSIYVALYAPGPDFYQQQDYFDLVELMVLDTLSINGVENNIGKAARIYPVPAKDHITIEVPDGYQPDSDITVFNSLGQVILKRRVLDKTIHLAKAEFEAGLFFFKITGGPGSQYELKGKFIFE